MVRALPHLVVEVLTEGTPALDELFKLNAARPRTTVFIARHAVECFVFL